ncbi:YhcN/YlaJ family sporulation lipoprotein [Paenibacillus sp. HB172176]|uniref:YhcN/YlaJ family sporulation lipoprotein n=1 Tax=Paenibacillus sp. HB172176 TaxID=2493690 RepID=UPI00143AB422|nr:YhcN/YlaJ family sporulation lipoprotein [Paenibacillus sp. HB172176]
MYKWITAACCSALLLSGCGANANPDSSPSQHNNGSLHAQENGAGKKLIEDRSAVEAHLEELAKGVDGVNDANCVIIGNTAIVGINVNGSVERSRVGTIKYSVAEAFHNDPYGIDAIVTADIDIRDRLKEIGADIRNGRPLSGFANEMADIIGRLIPQLPRNIAPPKPDEQAPAEEPVNEEPHSGAQ